MHFDLFKSLVMQSPLGIAICERNISTKASESGDYLFVEVNDAFGKITGFHAGDITGKKLTALIPTGCDCLLGISKACDQLSDIQQDAKFECYSSHTGRWYKVQVFSPETNFYAAVFADFTSEKASAAKLAQSEKRYRGLIESQNDLIVRVDNNNRFTFVNDAYCKAFGKSSEELIGKSFAPLVHSDDLPATMQELEKLKKPPHRCYVEQRAMTKDGWRWISWEDNAILDDNGHIVEIQGVGRDITHIKEKEVSVKKSAAFLEAILANTPAVVYAIEFQTGNPTVTYVNSNIKNVLGYEPADFSGSMSKWGDFVHPDDRERLSAVRKKTSTSMTPGQEFYDEYRFRDKNGNYRWLADRQKIIEGASGKPEIVGAFLDITSRMNALEAIENEKKLRQIIDNIDGVVWLRSSDRQEMLYVSPAYAEIFGRTQQSLYQNPSSFTNAIHPEDKQRVQAAYANFIKTGLFKEEYRIVRPDETIRWVTSQAFPVKDEFGQTIRYAGIVRDVTHAKRSELNALKLRSIRNQLDPHFTFNAFNAIASTFLKESDRTSYIYFTKFSKLLRGTMLYSDKMYRILQEEINCTEHYLEIEKFRFRNKFDYTIKITPEVNLHMPVPRMIIQAYAETAIANSLMHRTEDGMLTINLSYQANCLNIMIKDNGVGIEKSKLYNKEDALASAHLMDEFIGVINTMSRAKVDINMYDLQQNGTVTGTQVDINIPFDVQYHHFDIN